MLHLEFDETRDFPYYNHNPRISKVGWLTLLILTPLLFIITNILSDTYPISSGLIWCLGIIIPLLKFTNWDYRAIFKKPTKNEIILAFLMFVGYIIYAMIAGAFLDYFSLNGLGMEEIYNVDIIEIAALFFSMMGEELLKFIPLMFFMRVIYKYTNKRDLSFAVSAAIVMIGFGLLHYYPPYSTVASCILIQGFGTIFQIYGYAKTKNLWVPYISHLLIDMIVFSISLFV